jgi:hypothetical protein
VNYSFKIVPKSEDNTDWPWLFEDRSIDANAFEPVDLSDLVLTAGDEIWWKGDPLVFMYLSGILTNA